MSSLNKGGRCTRNRRRQHSMLTVVTTTAAVGQRNNNQNLSTIMSRDEHQILSSTTNQDLEHNNRGHMSKRPKLKTIDCRRTVTASSLKISSPLSRSGFEISNQQVRATSSSPALREGVFTSTQNQCHKNHKWDTSYHNDTNTLLPTDHQNLRQYICVTSPFSNNNKNLDSANQIATVDSVHQKQSRKRSPSTRPGRKHLTTLPQDIISATTHFLCVKDLVALCSTCRNCRTTLTTGPVMINMREIGTFPESNHLNKYVFTPKHQHTLDAMEQNTRSVIAQHRTCLNHMEKLCGLFQNACGLRLVHSKVAHDYRVSKHITQMLSHSLVSINFSGSLFVDERAFRRILTHCGRLQNLNLKGCRRVDGASIILKPRTTVFNALKSLHWLMVAGTSFSTMAVDALRRIIETIPASPQARRQRIYRRSLRGMRCCPNRQETANGVQTLSCAPFSSCTCASIHICISRTPALRQFMTTYLPDVVKGMKELVTLPYPEQQSENTINVARCPNTSVDQTPVTTAESELNTVFGVQTETSTQSLVGGVSAMDLSRQSTDRKEEPKQEKTLCWQVKYCFTRVQQLLLQFQMNLSALDSQLLSEYQRVNGATAAKKQTKIRIGSNLVPFKQFDSIRTMVDILQTDGRNTMIDAPLNAFHASALMFASLTGKRHAVEALVRQGADIEAATNAPNGPPSRASTLTQYLESIEEKLEQDEPLIGDDSHIPFHRDFLVEQGFIKDLDSEMGDTDHLDEFEQESAEQAHVWHATNNDREDGGATALYAASHRGHEGIVDMLIRHGADVGAVRDSGVSSLYVAAQEGHLSVLKRLLKAGAYVECRRMDGTTPLFIAAQEGNLEIVRNLLAAGADPNLANHEGVTGLCSAARWGHEGVVRLLLEHGAIPTYRDCSGATPLYCAAQEGHLGIVSVLLQHGARVDETGKDGATPLFVASSRGHREIVSLLLKSGSNPSHAMADGTTPIFIASQMGHRDIIAMICNARLRVPQLRDVKVDVNAPRSDAVTPLLIATAAGHTMCVRLLLAMGANPDILTDDGTSPLYLAAQEGNLGLVTALVEFGASTQLKDETGATALHIASHAGHVKVVQALLNAGGDPLAETAGGYIPLHYSIQAGHKQVSRELLAVPYAPHRQIQILHGMRQIQLDTSNAHRHAEEETGLI